MRSWMWIIAVAAPSFLTLGCPTSNAAVIKAASFACKSESLVAKSVEKPKGNGSDLASFQSKVVTGDCIQLTRGQQDSVDEKHGGLWCVRLMGALDCFWTPDKGVDLNATSSPAMADQPRHGRKH